MDNKVKIGIGVGVAILITAGVYFALAGNKNGTGENPLANLFPKINIGENTETNSTSTTNTNIPEGRLVSISATPVAGYTLVSSGGKKFVRYIEQGTGFIYDYDLATKQAVKISNQTLKGIQQVLWGAQGEQFIAQSYVSDVLITTAYSFGKTTIINFTRDLKLGDVNTDVLELQRTLNRDPVTQVSQTGLGSPGNETTRFGEATKKAVIKFQEKYSEEILIPQNRTAGSGIVDAKTREKLNELNKPSTDVTEVKLIEKRLPLGISSVTFSPDASKIFYFLSERGGGITGYSANSDGSGAKKLYSSAFGDLVPFWNDVNTILLTTKPSGTVNGFLYALNPLTGETVALLRNITGLTTQTSGNEASLLYSRKRPENGAPELSLYSRKNDVSEVLSLRTLPEKCAWGKMLLYCAVPQTLPPALYPDDWYKGKVSFVDALWTIDPSTKVQKMIAGGLPSIDAQMLLVSEEDETLYFINKNDLTLWSLGLR